MKLRINDSFDVTRDGDVWRAEINKVTHGSDLPLEEAIEYFISQRRSVGDTVVLTKPWLGAFKLNAGLIGAIVQVLDGFYRVSIRFPDCTIEANIPYEYFED